MRRRLKLFWLNHLHFLTRFWYALTGRLTWIKGPVVDYYASPEQIAHVFMSYNSYKLDPWGGKLDYMKHPRRVQKRLDSATPKPVGDCDDHGAYWCAALAKASLSREIYLGIYRAVDSAGEEYGHAVCVFKRGGTWFYADYGLPTPIETKWGFIEKDADLRGAAPIGGFLIRVRGVSRGDTLRFGRSEGRG